MIDASDWMKRTLCLAAYDVRDPKRLLNMLYTVKDFACGGQKSAFECWLSGREKNELLQRAQSVMAQEDAFLLVRLSVRNTVHILGIAAPARNEAFLYLG